MYKTKLYFLTLYDVINKSKSGCGLTTDEQRDNPYKTGYMQVLRVKCKAFTNAHPFYHRRLTSDFFCIFTRLETQRCVYAITLPLKPFLSILNQPSSMGGYYMYIHKAGNAMSKFYWCHGIPRISNPYFTLYRYFNAGCQQMSVFAKGLTHCLHHRPKLTITAFYKIGEHLE